VTPRAARALAAMRGCDVANTGGAVLHGDRCLQGARAKTESQEDLNIALAFRDEVKSRDATINHTVLHVFGHVVGPHKKQVNISVPAVGLQHTFARFLGRNAARFEQRPRRFAKPTL
jgi:hypothetical protein